MTTERDHLVLLEKGRPVMAYRVAGGEPSSGLEAIHGYLVDTFDFSGKHLVMLYDDPESARSVEFTYLREGLEKGERCQYVFAHDDEETPDSVRRKMQLSGIRASYFIERGLLAFTSMGDPASDAEGFVAGCRKALDMLVEVFSGKPRRMVLHVRYLFNTREEIDAHADFEDFIESTFQNFPGSMLCNHYVGKNDPEAFEKWTRRMLEIHDVVFLVGASPAKAANYS
jgi:hypothetical protein